MLYKPLVDEIVAYQDNVLPANTFRIMKQKHKFNGRNSDIMYMVSVLKHEFPYLIEHEDKVRNMLRIKRGKSHSGVLVITLFTSPYPEYYDTESNTTVKQAFTCHWNCAYCPNEPGQPRSYLKGEPGVLRANKNEFDCIKQMWDRMKSLYSIGHPVDKLEVIVLGGTWTSYPQPYREQFCRDIYFAANTFGKEPRDKLSLSEEKRINKDAQCKVIGLTLETRPDTVTPAEIKRLRYYGCTRVQLGIQHIDDKILEKINRKCSTSKTIHAIKLLKDTGFKVDAHWMPNLPGSSYEKDMHMFVDTLLAINNANGGPNIPLHSNKKINGKDVVYDTYNMKCPELQVDQWKVYPCSTVPWTDIEKWYKDGTYKPYDQEKLIDLVINIKTFMLPWIRLNRIIRDIPSDYIISTHDVPNMRQDAKSIMEREGKVCNCIRCREVKDSNYSDSKYVIREYNASEGKELFISCESCDLKTLYGFLRLRLPSQLRCQEAYNIFNVLEGCSFIRELHVYGQLQKVSCKGTHVQHKGIGKSLVTVAEHISKSHRYHKVCIIAGEGTKQYYEKLGYIEVSEDQGGFMVKSI
jgi:histone acetyltransferase (RNA polymerase elongator complex component)